MTVATFPLLYATLELPKLIINDAIGAESAGTTVLSMEIGQVQYLLLLCAAFLLTVIVWGLVKMRLNTMKGVIAERLLRRLRFDMVSRILRFPLPHFRRTSQGELVSMVTAEAEPLGGVMGDAVALPVFQAGQMLTILGFLFVQNVWLGLTAVALIPVQAWLIRRLQRQVNVLNKRRIAEVRALSTKIGETVGGVEDLRVNGGVAYTQAEMSDRLGRLFTIRHTIYRKKFFMKFVNNFITQLTPFFFFSIGGYLVIRGDLTLGALVAGLAAYKDLAAPWKELLGHYTRTQEMGQRYRTILEQFQPRGMIDRNLVEGTPETVPSLAGPVVMDAVTVVDADGAVLLDGLDLTIPQGASVGIASRNTVERQALQQVLSRAILPSGGHVTVAGHDLSSLHQGVISARMGVVGEAPTLFQGPIGANSRMALRRPPPLPDPLPADLAEALREARLSGNSPHPVGPDWIDFSSIGFRDEDAARDWWFRIVRTIGNDAIIIGRALNARFDAEAAPELAARLVALRPAFYSMLEAEYLTECVQRFARDSYTPAISAGSNLLYATRKVEIDPGGLSEDPKFLRDLARLGLAKPLMALGRDMTAVLVETFGEVGAEHPLFARTHLSETLFEQLQRIHSSIENAGTEPLAARERALLVAVGFTVVPENVGARMPDDMRALILERRFSLNVAATGWARGRYVPIDPEQPGTGLTLLENLAFGRVDRLALERHTALIAAATAFLEQHDLAAATALFLDTHIDVGIGGADTAPVARERIAFARACLKRPEILVLNRFLASHEPVDRELTRRKLRDLLPEATLIYIEPELDGAGPFDMRAEVVNGRLAGDPPALSRHEDAGTAQADLAHKLAQLAETETFAMLKRKQLRLLAFAAEWFELADGGELFKAGDRTDAIYLLVEGSAEPYAPGNPEPIDRIGAGRIIGDVSVIRGSRRTVTMKAKSRVRGLKIGAKEMMDVISSAAAVATALLRQMAETIVHVEKKFGRDGEPA